MSTRNLNKLFRPASVALFGASPQPGSLGQVAMRNLRRAGFTGSLMLVNPHHRTIEGMPVFQDVESMPRAPDLAVLATPPETMPGLVAQLGARGTRAAVIMTAGFAELGARGRALQAATLEAARPHLLRIIGPNCVGVLVPAVGLNASFAHLTPRAGDLAFVSQSGAMITAVLDWAESRRIGFSHVVSLGDMADVDFGDMLDYLEADSDTRAILLYVEGITHARKFMSAARLAARGKPVVAVKVGRHAESARAALSHTGALAGSDAVYDAVFRRAGMLRVQEMEALFDAAETLALTTPQRGDRLAIMTNGGGPGVLATDSVIDLGGRLASLTPATITALDKALPRTWSHGNPVDIVGDAPPARYRDALSILLEDPGIDAVLVLSCPTAIGDPVAAAQAVSETVAQHRAGASKKRNIYTSWLGEHSAVPARRLLAEAGIATYETPDRAVRGFMDRVQFQHAQELLTEAPPARLDDFMPERDRACAAISAARAAGREWLDPGELASLLGAYGIPLVATRLVEDVDKAVAAANSIGYPVALKIRSPDITHKTDVGAVALNLGSADRVRSEAALMLARVRQARPDAGIAGFQVQQMIHRPGALELIVGVVDDATFGPVLLFGQGGIAVETLGDTSLELPPLNDALARALMARTRVWKLMQGVRGLPPADISATARTLVRVSQMIVDHAEIRELDINPLLADANGVLALDARIRIGEGPAVERLAILPYPRELDGSAQLPTGERFRLRPIRPEDAARLSSFIMRMHPDDRQFRFGRPIDTVPQTLLARLTQIDYDREIALVALPNGGDEIVGVARYCSNPDRRDAEFAISVRADWKRRGLETLLLDRLVVTAEQRRIARLHGDIAALDQNLLGATRTLGFTVELHAESGSPIRVMKQLCPD